MIDPHDRLRVFSELGSEFAYAFAVDEAGGLEVEWVSDALPRLTGWTMAELRERGGWPALIHPDDRPLTENQLRALLFGDDATVEYRIVKPDGEVRWVRDHGRVERDPDTDQVVRIYGTVQDVSEWKRTLDALLESELRHRHVVERSPFPIAAFGADHRVEYLNPQFTELFGYTVRDVPTAAEWIRRAVPEEPLCQRLTEEWYAVVAAGARADVGSRVVDVRCAGGETRTISARLFGTGGGRYYLMAEDITELSRAEGERRALEARLQHGQKLESLGVLAGGIAHDFNNLLVGILGYADLASLRLAPDDPVAALVTQIQTSARRLGDLTAQLQAYSGEGTAAVEALELCALVEEMAHLLEVSISKRARLRRDFCDGLPPVEADASQVRQIVMNLITNASDALGGREGTIVLRTGLVHADRDYLSRAYLDESLPEGDYVFLEVEDDGQGMDPETVPRIFDPFFTTRTAGRGLGLASVLGIVRGHRGTLEVDSEVGRGTRVRVLFPAAVAAVAAGEVPPSADPERAAGGTVLVVDDDDVVRDVACAMLRQAGYATVQATDGAGALALHEAARSDIVAVILDLTMPGIDSQQIHAALRERDADLPIVVCSGYGEPFAADRFQSRGDVTFLPKPFDSRSLLRALRMARGG